MSNPPWIELVALRRARGLTQAELAAGIVSQSMLAQVECGRILPSNKTLTEIGKRLALEPEQLVNQWSAWRNRDQIRRKLWSAAKTVDTQTLKAALDAGDHVLVPFESHVYRALWYVLVGERTSAQKVLDGAWRGFSQEGHDEPPGRVRSYSADVETQAVFARAWTSKERSRALVVEAWVQERLCRLSGRTLAALWWKRRADERLAGTR